MPELPEIAVFATDMVMGHVAGIGNVYIQDPLLTVVLLAAIMWLPGGYLAGEE